MTSQGKSFSAYPGQQYTLAGSVNGQPSQPYDGGIPPTYEEAVRGGFHGVPGPFAQRPALQSTFPPEHTVAVYPSNHCGRGPCQCCPHNAAPHPQLYPIVIQQDVSLNRPQPTLCGKIFITVFMILFVCVFMVILTKIFQQETRPPFNRDNISPFSHFS